ncbi:hypothetical protein ACN27F_13465 [Solwaraspora sp. WMMB335]|uniref:hypothetical protein n=1 Tax=Solwaraspora sp. WMMB335 TaxID=3404118 RepID=UPI003B93B6B5
MPTAVIVTVTVSALVPLACAIIAGIVAIYGKRVDGRVALDGRHAQARESAYDLILAAGDVAWNFIARSYVDEVDGLQSMTKRDREEGTRRCHALLVQGIDQLESHAADMNVIRPVLGKFYQTIFANNDGSAAAYEQVRASVVDCRRRDSGLNRILRERPSSGWRQLIPTRAVREWRRRLRSQLEQPLYRGIQVDQVIRTVDGTTLVSVPDGERFAAILDEQLSWAREMRASVATTEARIAHWRQKGALRSPEDPGIGQVDLP